MAYVYADMDALGTYQQDIVRVIGVLREEANSKEELIEATERTIREALDRAEEAEHMASASLQVAEEQLAEAEMRTREHNANLGEDEEPATTPEFYYDNVYEKQAQYDYAADVREDTQNILDEFRAYVRRYRQQQAAGIAEINKLVASSGRFFAGYIKVLIEAKKCTAFSGGGGSGRSGNGGSARSAGNNLFSQNVLNTAAKYPLSDGGWFGSKGKNCREIFSQDQNATALDFYKTLSNGGEERPLDNGKGVQTVFPCGARVVYRDKTSTPNSPAVEITPGGCVFVKRQKIHFEKGK